MQPSREPSSARTVFTYPGPGKEFEIMASPSDPSQTPGIDPYTALRMRFAENRNNFPAGQLAAYGGKVVAWWPDGSRIVDADDDAWALWCRLRASGHEPAELVYERLPLADESFV
jgi:hypothetical protein